MGETFRERRFTAQDGLSLYCRDYGDPLWKTTPVLCLGGLTRNSKDFHGLALWLAALGRRVVCPDYRGRGRSQYDPDWRNYKPETYVGDIRQLLAAAGLHRAIVVGTSLGGILAMALGAAAPTAVVGAVLNDVGAEVPRSGLKPILAYMQDDRPMPDWESATERLKATFPDWPAKTPEDWALIARATYREAPDGIRFDWDTNIVKPLLPEADSPDPVLWPLFHGLDQVPVLSIRGEKSAILTAELSDRMAAARPDLLRALVPGVGHAPGLSEPEARAGILALLERVP